MSSGRAPSTAPPTRFDRIWEQEIGATFNSSQRVEHDHKLECVRQQLAVYESSYQELEQQIKMTQEAIAHFLNLLNGLETTANEVDPLAAMIKQLKTFGRQHILSSMAERPL